MVMKMARQHRASGRRAAGLAGSGLLAAGVTGALYVAGRLHTPDYTFALFGQVGLGAVALKALLASIVLAGAALQVVLALWIYHKLPVAGHPPRPVRPAHRILGLAVFTLTVPIAVHCLIAYGVQLTSPRWRCTPWPAASSMGRSLRRCYWCTPAGCPAGHCPPPVARSPSSPPCSGTPPRCGTTTATSSPASNQLRHRAASRGNAAGDPASARGAPRTGPFGAQPPAS